jgi:hypothetical protein
MKNVVKECWDDMSFCGTPEGTASHLVLTQDLPKAPYEDQGLAHDIHHLTLSSEYCALASKEVYPEVE